jgi:hypothetical protein
MNKAKSNLVKKEKKMKTLNFSINFSIIILLTLIGSGLAQSNDIRITNNGKDQNISTIAIDPLNSNNLMSCWQDFQSDYWSEPGYGFSTNGGNNWTTGILPDHNGYECGLGPSCAFDRANHAFYGHIASPDYQIPGPVYVSETANYGILWSHFQASGSGADDNDLPHIAVDNTVGTYSGRIYASWTEAPLNNPKILFAYSSGYGSGFSTPIELASATGEPGSNAYLFPDTEQPTTPDGYLVTASMPAVGPNGEVYVVWADVVVGPGSSLKIRKSTNGGANFGSTITAASFTEVTNVWGKILVFNFPSLAVDPSNGYVYLAYADEVSNKPRLKFVRSTNGGTNWSSPSIIGNLGEQGEAIPAIACDSYGKVAISFIHRHNDSKIGFITIMHT